MLDSAVNILDVFFYLFWSESIIAKWRPNIYHDEMPHEHLKVWESGEISNTWSEKNRRIHTGQSFIVTSH